METKTLPEVDAITNLIAGLRANGETQQPAITVISALFAGDKTTPAEGFLELIRIVNYLPTLVADLPPGGPQRVGENVAQRIKRLVDPELLAIETRQYLKRSAADFDFIDGAIHIFNDMHYDSAAFVAKTADLYAFIDEMKVKFGLAESLSDASKTVLFAQLDLLRSSVHRFQTSGVGPFRDSVFSIYGRIVMELNADKKVTQADKNEIIDQFLRFYDLSQAVGSLVKLGAPFIAGYLTHGAA